LQKVKNNLTASNFRRLQSDFFLMFQLLMAESDLGWQSINTDPPKQQAVTAADVQRVAKQYFAPENRNVLILYTKRKGAAQ
jgi:predicted Zn-dependent peptidase